MFLMILICSFTIMEKKNIFFLENIFLKLIRADVQYALSRMRITLKQTFPKIKQNITACVFARMLDKNNWKKKKLGRKIKNKPFFYIVFLCTEIKQIMILSCTLHIKKMLHWKFAIIILQNLFLQFTQIFFLTV